LLQLSEPPPEHVHLDVQVLLALPGGIFLPERVDQRAYRHDASGGQGQHRQQHPQVRLGDRGGRFPDADLDRPEQADSQAGARGIIPHEHYRK